MEVFRICSRGPLSLTERVKEGAFLLKNIVELKNEIEVLVDHIVEHALIVDEGGDIYITCLNIGEEGVTQTISYCMRTVVVKIDNAIASLEEFRKTYPQITYEIYQL